MFALLTIHYLTIPTVRYLYIILLLLRKKEKKRKEKKFLEPYVPTKKDNNYIIWTTLTLVSRSFGARYWGCFGSLSQVHPLNCPFS